MSSWPSVRNRAETERERESGKQTLTGEMQKELCRAYKKHYPFVEAGLIVNETTLFLDTVDTPLLYVSAEGRAIEVIFTRQTDMRRIDECFRGQPSFEEDMRDGQ